MKNSLATPVAIGALGAIITLGLSGVSQAQPLPLDDRYVIFGSVDDFQFNTITGFFSIEATVTAVQFPFQRVSTTDPLVLANTTMSERGFYTGDTFGANPEAVFLDVRMMLTVGDQLVFSVEVPEMSFERVVELPNGELDFLWAGEPLDPFFNLSVVGSPFLDQIPEVIDSYAGRTILRPSIRGIDWDFVPEIDPGSMASALTLLVGGVLVLTGRRRLRLA